MNNEQLQHIHPHDEALWEKILEASPRIFLAFSCGKDSIAAWLALRKWGGIKDCNIIPYYMFLVPNLSFINNSLDYFEQFFQTKIKRIPHPSLYRMINNLVFQPPENCSIIERCCFTEPSFDDILARMSREMGFSEQPIAVNGVRCCDSIYRRLSIERHGPLHGKKCSAIWNWNKAKTMGIIKDFKCKLPVDYDSDMFGRSFDGIDYRFLEPVRRRFPDDYQKILDLFPMADLELFRREMENENGKA